MNKAVIVKSLLACIVFTFFPLAIASNNNTLKNHDGGILEVVMFSAKPDYTNEQVVKRANAVTAVLQSYPGFLSRKLSENTKENNKWIDIIHWSSLHDALMAANKIVRTAQMRKFMSVMKDYTLYHFQIRCEVGK